MARIINKAGVIIRQRVVQNLGFQNLVGKSLGKGIFFLIQMLLAYYMSIEGFANYAIFWSLLRLYTFFGSNNFYILYFKEARKTILNESRLPEKLIDNSIITYIAFSVLFFPATVLLFNSFYTAILLTLSAAGLIIIRIIAEVSKVDNSVRLSIFLEDFILNLIIILFLFIAMTLHSSSFDSVVLAITSSLVIASLISLLAFKKKFNVSFSQIRILRSHLSYDDFKMGFRYTLLRSGEVIYNFAVRYLGKIFFGVLFVSYAHVMIQFFNIFSILTLAVISGLQSKIVLHRATHFTKKVVKKIYLSIIYILSPVIIVAALIFGVLNEDLIRWTFPKFEEFSHLLWWVAITGFIFSIFQPLIYIFIYNNKFPRINRFLIIQYLSLLILIVLPIFKLNQNIWLFGIMIIFPLCQGIACLAWLKKSRA